MKIAHIYIYGEIGWWQSKDAKDYGEVVLTDIHKQYEAQKDAEEIHVHIHSNGGYVSEGFAIHDYLKAQGKPITTIIEGMCYSIATVIALAGDKRIMTPNSEFMTHNPMNGDHGNADELQAMVDDLRKTETRIADFYALNTKKTAVEHLELMKKELFITPQEALEFGFITEIQSVTKAVARFEKKEDKKKSKNKSNKNLNKMAKKNKDLNKKKAEGLGNALAKLIAKTFGNAKNIVLQDANGTEIDFPEVEEGQSPAVGDAATIGGEDAAGEYTINGDVFTFADGKVSTIVEAEEEEVKESEEVVALNEEVAKLTKKNTKLQKKLDKEVAQNAKNMKSLKSELKKIQNLAGDIDFDTEGSGNKKKEKDSGSKKQKTRQVFKKEETK